MSDSPVVDPLHTGLNLILYAAERFIIALHYRQQGCACAE